MQVACISALIVAKSAEAATQRMPAHNDAKSAAADIQALMYASTYRYECEDRNLGRLYASTTLCCKECGI